jgi:toxin secretion/phage lysis holin
MHHVIHTLVGLVGATFAALFGGWDMGLQVLVTFMVVDYTTGLIVAGVFHKSGKTESGRLESRAGFKGLCRKGMELALVLVGTCLDHYTGNSFIRDAVVITFAVNEALSILENAALMGVPIPETLKKVLEEMQKGGDTHDLS